MSYGWQKVGKVKWTHGTCLTAMNRSASSQLPHTSHRHKDQFIMFKLAVLVHKCLNGCAPAYLIDDCRLIRPRWSGLRSSSSTIKLEVPPTRTTFGDRSFAVDGPRVWNSLPASIRNPSLSLTVFTNRLKTYLFRQQLRRLWLGMDAPLNIRTN